MNTGALECVYSTVCLLQRRDLMVTGNDIELPSKRIGPILRRAFICDPAVNLLLDIKNPLYLYLKRMFKECHQAITMNRFPDRSPLRYRTNSASDIAKLWL